MAAHASSHPMSGDELSGDELSIVIPAYNEARRILQSLERLRAYLTPRFARLEVLVVDDGSTDGTADLVESASIPGLRCLRNSMNFGKGYSVRRGMLAAKFDPVLFSDADFSTPPEDAERLLDALRSGADIAIGSRRLAKRQDVHRSLGRKLLSWGFAKLVQCAAFGGIHDTQCGFKMFRRWTVEQIFPFQRIDRWGFDVEILFIARKRGLGVAEVPVRWYQSEGTRLHWFTPLTMAADLVRIRWNHLLGRYQGGSRQAPGQTVPNRADGGPGQG
jgi:glycosyltransferase involved in cell wall biosynthesis